MQIVDVVLFISKVSKECMPCVNFIGQNRIPVSIVKLDTESSRLAAQTNKNFQITGVPTLLVVFDNGKVQLFTGRDSIIPWLNNTIKNSQQNNNPQQDYPQQQQDHPQEPQQQEPYQQQYC